MLELEYIEESPRKIAEELDNWAPIDLDLWSGHPKVDTAVDLIYQDMAEAGFKGQPTKRKRHIRIVILDLLMKWACDPSMYSGYHRNNNEYAKINSRYNKNGVSRLLIEVVKAMKALGYIEGRKGHYDRAGTRKSHISRMRATKKLIGVLTDELGLTADIIEKRPDTECIILKDKHPRSGRKYLIPYEDTPDTIRMRFDLQAYNNLIRLSFIDLPHFPIEGVVSDEGKRRVRMNRRDKFVRRIFNNGSWDDGGRFYGGWWQRLPKRYRERIKIGHSPVIEIDYSGLHVILLYALEGIDYWAAVGKDPYQIPGLEASDRMRSLLKVALLVAINSTSRMQALRAIRQEISFKHKDKFDWVADSGIDLREIIDAFAKAHDPIANYLFSGYGLRLQNLDSMMADFVINAMTKNGQVVLCVHDSFIVQSELEKPLKALMVEAMDKILVDHGVGALDTPPHVSTLGVSASRYHFCHGSGGHGPSGDPDLPYSIVGICDYDHEMARRFIKHNERRWEPAYYR